MATTAGFHDTGAIYDLVKPTKNTMKPVGEWGGVSPPVAILVTEAALDSLHH